LSDGSLAPFNISVSPHLLLGILLIGAGVGLLAGALGKGGSAVSTPLLHAIGVPAMVAVASPLPATIPSTWWASRTYAHEGQIDRRVVRIGLIVGIPATVAGAWLTQWIPGASLVLVTDALVLLIGLRVLLGSHDQPVACDGPAAGALATVLVVAAAGVASGLLGNSGGFLLAPLFIAVLHLPVRRALGTSLALATVLAIPGTIVHAYLGHIDWSITLVFGLAAVPLAGAGARLAFRLRERPLTLAFGTTLTLVAGGLLAFAR
jgi:uncharacterized membrane protein YfcA